MILSFDKFERYELPQVTLCNPNSRATEVDGKITITDTVGVLSNPKGMNLKLNFNAPHELSFDYYRHKSSDPIKQSFYDSIYEAIQTDRYIYLTDIGYFIISSVTDSDEDNIDKKSISCKSCEENEFAIAEGLYLEEGTYQLHTQDNKGLLDLFLPKTAGWTIGYIDPSLLTKPYFVEETEVDNGYNFLYTTIQDMFECIVEPDIIRRTISVYSRVYYAEHHLTDIHIAKYNLLKHKIVEENDEDKYTALNVQGKDENLEIRAVNPTGKNVIYNFEPRYSWMSPALQQAIEKWQEKCESVEEEYFNLQKGYYNDMQNIVFPLEEDIKVLEFQLKEKEQTRDTIVYGDYDKEKYGEIQQDALDAVNVEITTITGSITDKKETLEVEQNKIQTNYSERIDQINLECALETTDIFTTELRNELMTHIKPTDYVDEYMLVTESMTYPQRFEKAKELMDRAQSQLVKISSGQKTYSIDTRSFLFNKQFRHFSEQLCAGAIIYVETKNDKMEQLHLTGIDINFDEKSTNFTLGNKYNRSDLKALYEDVLGQHSKSFSELKYIASIVEDQQKQLNGQKNWAADLRTLTLEHVLTSEDQAFEINNRGITGRKRQLNEDGSWKTDENDNPLFDPEQIKIINNTIVFTDDNWNSAATAVGKIAVGYNSDGSVKYSYGINGQVLIGELILGNNLVLTGTGAGIKIKDNGGKDTFYADSKGNLVLLGHIRAKSLTLEGCTISTNDISGLSNVAISGKYDDLLGKPEIPTSVNDLGFDTSEIIYKGDITQITKTDSQGNKYIQTKVPTANGYITYDTFDAGNYIVFDRYAGEDSAGKNYVCISKEGLLTARNALIYGTIHATDGEIGNWQLSDGKLYYHDDTNKLGTGMATVAGDTSIAFWAGYTGDYSDPYTAVAAGEDWGSKTAFFVRNNGQVKAISGNIAGFTLNKNALYNGTNSLTSTVIGVYIGTNGIRTVDKDGSVTIQGYNTHLDSNYGSSIDINGDGMNINACKIDFYSNKAGTSYKGGIDHAGIYDSSGNCFIDWSRNIIGKKGEFSSTLDVDGKLSVFGGADISGTLKTYGQLVLDDQLATKGKNPDGGYYYRTYMNSMNRFASGDTKYFIQAQKSNAASDGNYNTVYSVNFAGDVKCQTCTDSDERLKYDIINLSEQYSILFDNLRPVTFKYKHGDSGRAHTGLIAQEVKSAMEMAGLSDKDFAAYVREVTDDYGLDGYSLALRYSEFIALLINEVQKLKAEKVQIYERLSKIESALGL